MKHARNVQLKVNVFFEETYLTIKNIVKKMQTYHELQRWPNWQHVIDGLPLGVCSNPNQVLRCFREHKTFILVAGWFQEEILRWFHKRNYNRHKRTKVYYYKPIIRALTS